MAVVTADFERLAGCDHGRLGRERGTVCWCGASNRPAAGTDG